MIEDLHDSFIKLSHQDKYDKLMICLYIAQKSEQSLTWLFLVLQDLGSEYVDDTYLVELYDIFTDLVDLDEQQKSESVKKIKDRLDRLKRDELEENKNELSSIDSFIDSL